MSKVKSFLANPYLLGAQGFLAGALLLWSHQEVPQPVAAPAPTALVQLAPSAS
ncbi:MAG TPA: hypothetical protein VGB54_04685 [Allosphingosinicella sp.]